MLNIRYELIEIVMGKADKILAKMKQNPHDWRIDSIKTVAKNYDIQWRQKKKI